MHFIFVLLSADFLQQKKFTFVSGIYTIRVSNSSDTEQAQIRPDILMGLLWVQTACMDYQDTALWLSLYKTVKIP